MTVFHLLIGFKIKYCYKPILKLVQLKHGNNSEKGTV